MMLLVLFYTEDFGDYHCAGHAESGTGTDHNKQRFLLVSESGETWSQYKGTVWKIPFLIWDTNISGPKQKNPSTFTSGTQLCFFLCFFP